MTSISYTYMSLYCLLSISYRSANSADVIEHVLASRMVICILMYRKELLYQQDPISSADLEWVNQLLHLICNPLIVTFLLERLKRLCSDTE